MSQDVRQLLESLGLSKFPYREVRARERWEAAAIAAGARRPPIQAEAGSSPNALANEPEPPLFPSESAPPLPAFTVAFASVRPAMGCTMLVSNVTALLTQEGRSCVSFALDAQSAEGDPHWLRKRLIDATPAKCELVALDVSSRPSPLRRQALALADLVLLVLRPEPDVLTVFEECETLMTANARHSTLHERTYFLVNRFDGRRRTDRTALAALRGVLGQRMVPWVIQEDSAVDEALLRRRSLLEEAADSQVVADIQALAEWVMAQAAGGKRGREGAQAL